MPSGAAMPRRTVCPLTPMTVTRISSPMTTRSPGRRVRISMTSDYEAIRGVPAGSALGSVDRRSGLGDLLGREREERCLERCLLMRVDHLVSASLLDHQGRTQVGRDVKRVGGGTHRDEHSRRREVLDADQLLVLGRDLQDEVREELQRVDDRKREGRVIDGVQPEEARPGVAVDQRIAHSAQSDQTEGKLEEVLLVHLDRAKADALECHRHYAPPFAFIYWRKLS